jgi:hypothetical protein
MFNQSPQSLRLITKPRPWSIAGGTEAITKLTPAVLLIFLSAPYGRGPVAFSTELPGLRSNRRQILTRST